MTREEAKTLLSATVVCYPNYKPTDMKLTVDVWATLLADYDYNEVSNAMQSYIMTDTSGFAPSIGQLVDYVHKIRNEAKGNNMSDAECWDIVRKAIADSSYHAQERFDAFPEDIKKAVGSPNQLRVWATDPEFNDGVVQSNFLRSLRTEKKRSEELEKLPQKVKDLIGTATNNMRLENKDGIKSN